MRRWSALAAVLAAAALAACSSTASPGGADPNAPASTTGPPAVTPAELSKAIGCSHDPGPGVATLSVGGTQFACLGTETAMVDEGAPFAAMVFFTSKGAEGVYLRRYTPSGSSSGQMQVVGDLWVVWGTDQAVIAAAIDQGGTQS